MVKTAVSAIETVVSACETIVSVVEKIAQIEESLGGIDTIFQFSENRPANYNFSLFLKLPTNYPKNQKIFKKQSIFSENTGVPPYFRLFFEYFLNFWFTLKNSGF